MTTKLTDWYLGQASNMSHDILIEKIHINTGFKLSFTSPSIKELAASFRMDSHQSIMFSGLWKKASGRVEGFCRDWFW